jgi:hypothetical protein
MYLEYLDEDEDIPFRLNAPEDEDAPAGSGPAIREGVDIGANVLDLNAMRADLEEARKRRGGNG